MVRIIRTCAQLEYRKILDVYEGSLRQIANDSYGGMDPNVGMIYAEQDFYAYIRDVFLKTEGAFYGIMEMHGMYVCAVRVEPYLDGMLIAGLETMPSCRSRGFAYELLSEVGAYLVDCGCTAVYSHIHKDNFSSLRVHEKCGFTCLREDAVLIDGTISYDMRTMIKILS